MSGAEAALLIAGGVLAGIVNTMAGGGSMLTVPLLVLLGLPGIMANGTNRIGILLQTGVASWRFRAEGVSGFRDALPVLAPVALGSALGAFGVSRLADETFERLFGLMMLLLLVPTLRRSTSTSPAGSARARHWPPTITFLAFFAIGLYGGAIQVGLGLVLVFALSHAGFDLVRANSIKVVVSFALTVVAVPVFIVKGQVVWGPALLLAVGFAAGAALGARLAVRGGERVIRPVLALAVLALAGRMLALY